MCCMVALGKFLFASLAVGLGICLRSGSAPSSPSGVFADFFPFGTQLLQERSWEMQKNTMIFQGEES